MSGGPWDSHAGWWQRQFTDGVDPEYQEQILPLVEELTLGFDKVLDIGCGEGQVTRALPSKPSRVVGVDPSWKQVSKALERSVGEVYIQASADELPLVSGAFDAAVACLVFEHITEMREAVAEVARILKPGGRFVFLLNHPLLQTPGSGWVEDYPSDPPSQYWRIGQYLVEQETLEEVELGVEISFVHRPLSVYLNALAENELMLKRMVEPAPPEGFLERNVAYRSASHIPRLLVLVCEKQ